MAWKNFYRESGLSFVSVFVLMIVVTLSATVLLVGGVAEIIIKDIEQKADVTIDFQIAVEEEEILEIAKMIEEDFDVISVTYTSREDVRNAFIERFGDREAVMESLEEVGNPFLASLNINAEDPYTYRQIASYLEENHQRDIYNIDFHNRENVINTIFTVTNNIRSGAVSLGIVLGIIAALLVFSTIKLAIYGIREEIKVMRLVGSSNVFIQSSFIIQGAIIGISAVIISFLVLFLLGFMIPQSYNITIEVNLHQYFLEMLPYVVLVQLGIGLTLGVISSMIATSRYLK